MQRRFFVLWSDDPNLIPLIPTKRFTTIEAAEVSASAIALRSPGKRVYIAVAIENIQAAERPVVTEKMDWSGEDPVITLGQFVNKVA